MSFKLKVFSGSLLVILALGLTAYKTYEPREPSIPTWSKARAPVSVRIIEQDYSRGTVTLEAQVRSSFTYLETEWILPEGVRIISGSERDSMVFSDNSDVQSQTVTLSISDYIGAQHVNFHAYTLQDGERLGAMMSYSLAEPDSEEKQKLERIREHMKARGDNPLQ